jgi:hypothetical protein
MDHITLFKTAQEYKDAKDSLLIPNVSYIEETDSVEYMKKHVIDFGTDSTSKSMCVSRWDTDGDGEISFEEAAAVKNIGTIFTRAAIVDGIWLKYFKGLSSLSGEAFRYAASLTNLAIPKNITTIGNNYINNATALRDIYFYWTTIPSYQNLASGLITSTIQHIYIPKGTYTIYADHARFSANKSKLIELEKMP